jgi:CheY-like chemotaxis protein
VVDDDEAMRVTVEATLEGYEVVLAASAAEALAALAIAEFDMVLCDLLMPQMTGSELYESLEADSPLRSKFVFMSGGSLPIGVESFVALAQPRMLYKPFTIAQLREVVAELLLAQAQG